MARFFLTLVTIAAILLLAAANHWDWRPKGKVVAEFGMSVEEFQRRSSHELHDQTMFRETNPDTRLVAHDQFDFEFVLDGETLRLPNTGPEGWVHSFGFDDDVLDSIKVYPHHNYLTIQGVERLAGDIQSWFDAAGFQQTDRFAVRRVLNRDQLPEPITPDQIGDLLRDQDVLVADMVIYHAVRENMSVVIEVSSGPRMRHIMRTDAPYGGFEAGRRHWMMGVWISNEGIYADLVEE